MRIDLYGSNPATTESIDQSSKVTEVSANSTRNAQAATGNAVAEDTTNLSSGSDSVKTLTQAALQTIPSRAARVENLRQAVNNAQYQLDASQIADSLSSSTV